MISSGTLVQLNIPLSGGQQGEAITGVWNFLNFHSINIPPWSISLYHCDITERGARKRCIELALTGWLLYAPDLEKRCAVILQVHSIRQTSDSIYVVSQGKTEEEGLLEL